MVVISTDALVVAETLISKHGLESVNDPDDNLTPILHLFAIRNVTKW